MSQAASPEMFQPPPARRAEAPVIPPTAWRHRRRNVQGSERLASLIGGAAIATWGGRRGGALGAGAMAVGAALLVRGLTETDPLAKALTPRPAAKRLAREQGWRGGAMSVRAMTINAPRERVYAAWRDFEQLPRFMENIERVEVQEGGRFSHWVAKGANGALLEWDAELTAEEPGRRLAWRSTPGSDIQTMGELEFQDAAGGRGCEVRATMVYEAVGGPLGRLVGLIFQKEPGLQARRDLRRFKQFLETGEVATAKPPHAAPRAEG